MYKIYGLLFKNIHLQIKYHKYNFTLVFDIKIIFFFQIILPNIL